MFVKPSSAFVEKPSLVASSSGSAKKARYARLFPSTRKSSLSRAGASSTWSSSPVRVFGITPSMPEHTRRPGNPVPDFSLAPAYFLYRPSAMPELKIQPFADEHLEAAAKLLAERHRRHREAEPLLPEVADPLTEIERDWRSDGASGVFASRGGKPVGYLIAAPTAFAGT